MEEKKRCLVTCETEFPTFSPILSYDATGALEAKAVHEQLWWPQ